MGPHAVRMPLPLILRHLAVLRVLLFLTACNEGDSRNINFHNLKPPVDATPFPQSFKCFTCEQASDNYNCNRWAEDKWCPENAKLCMTIHRFGSHGKSRSVTKRCAARDDCQTVGCRHHRDSGHTECVSCCEGMVCNVEVPTNHSNAILALRHTHSSSVHFLRSWKPPSVLALVTLALLVLW